MTSGFQRRLDRIRLRGDGVAEDADEGLVEAVADAVAVRGKVVSRVRMPPP